MLDFFVKKAYALDTAIDVSFFGKTTAAEQSDTIFFIVAGVIIGVLIVVGILHKWRSNRMFLESRKKISQRKKLMVMQSQNISPEAANDLELLAKNTKTKMDHLLGNNQYFESAVKQFVKKSPSDPFLNKVPALRDELGFLFNNRKVPFITSKMLPPGSKVRVGVKAGGKAHSYVGTILNSNETEFWVKPPTVKGKVIDMSKFRHLQFRVFRQHDGEYSFDSELKQQINKPVSAIIVPHSETIKKLRMREQDRYEINFKRVFYFLVDTQNLDQGSQAGQPVEGMVLDISVGGMKVAVKEIPNQIMTGTTAVFELAEAKIKTEVRANVVRVNSTKDAHYIHLQFNNLTELSRLNLQKWIASKKAKKLPEK